MPNIQELPIELLLDNLLPNLELKHLLNLSCTNKYFSELGNEDILWKRKLWDDYNFDGSRTARQNGWKVIYKGLENPELYMWGETSNGRLGLDRVEVVAGGVPTPTRLRIPNAHIIDLAAGGWSFHALDSRGRIHAWGQLNDGYAIPEDGFEARDKRADEPLRLEFPKDIKISKLRCGRSFALALDRQGNVWTFVAWGLPYRFSSLMTTGSPIVEIECGWDSAFVLTEAGDVFFWRPLEGDLYDKYDKKMTESDAQGGSRLRVIAVDRVVKCHTWEVTDVNPTVLPPIPSNLPALKEGGEHGIQAKLIKIAAGGHFVIGLTNGGHVLGIDIDHQQPPDRARWTYMPAFCDAKALLKTGVFEAQRLHSPEHLEITHISAHFWSFATYSVGTNSHVLMHTQPSDVPPTPFDQMRPTVMPALHNRSVVSIHMGDYHYGALTSDGELYTWGQYSRGALGLGDPRKIPVGEPGGYDDPELANANAARLPAPPDVTEPTRVKFGKGDYKGKFCFGAAASGWHFGALVIDTEGKPGGDEDDKDEKDDTPNTRYLISQTRRPRRGGFINRIPPPTGAGNPPQGIGHHVVPQPLGAFRIGFAGRGARRGRGG